MIVEVRKKEVEVPLAYHCDGCGKRLVAGFEEEQEMLHWVHRGAYGSVFGDGEDLSLDLCQECVLRMLGPVLQHHANADEPDADEPNPMPRMRALLAEPSFFEDGAALGQKCPDPEVD